MAEEINQKDQEIVSSDELLKFYKQFSNPVLINSVLYDGMQIILSKLVKIEEKLEKIQSGNIK